MRDAGLIWVGPDPEAISARGDKVAAREAMAAAGVPVAPGSSGAVAEADAAVAEATRIGFPVMLKAAAGGGGMGMTVAADEDAVRAEHAKISACAEQLFGDPRLFVERYFPRVRHGRCAGTQWACHRVADQRRGPETVPARPGPITEWAEPSGDGVRVDAGYARVPL